eukprot:4473872-Alexandrium_andersonii.AAC.1
MCIRDRGAPQSDVKCRPCSCVRPPSDAVGRMAGVRCPVSRRAMSSGHLAAAPAALLIIS